MAEKPVITEGLVVQTKPGHVTIPENTIAIVNDNGTLKSQLPDGTLAVLGGGGGGLNQLTGDVLAGPGTGSQSATIQNLPASVLATRIAALTGNTAAIIKTDSSGNQSPAVAGTDYAGANWYSQRLAEIKAVAPNAGITSICWNVECTDLTQQVTAGSVVGSGNVALLTTAAGGVIQVSSGTGGGTSLRVLNSFNSNRSLVANCKTNHWAIMARVKILSTPDGTTYMPILCLSGPTVDHVFGVRGASYSGGSTTNFVLFINGSGTTTSITSQAFILGSYINLVMVFDGTALTGIVNGTSVGTITDLTNFDTGAAYARLYSTDGTGTVNQFYNIDTWAVAVQPDV